MKCLKKVIIGFGIFLPVLLSVLFVSPSYAVSDITVTHSSVSTWQDIFSNCTGNCLNDYSYLIITPESTVYSSYYTRFYLRFDGSTLNTWTVSISGSSIIVQLPFDGHSYNLLEFRDNSTFYTPLTFTLTDHLGESCPEPEEPEPCPVIPENPYDNKLDNITMAIYTCGGILLVLYFFYCIYRIIIKNSGVSNL